MNPEYLSQGSNILMQNQMYKKYKKKSNIPIFIQSSEIVLCFSEIQQKHIKIVQIITDE